MMGVKTVSKFQCDLCDNKATAAVGTKPDGWVVFSTDGMIDREYIDHAVCKSCVACIVAADKKRKGGA